MVKVLLIGDSCLDEYIYCTTSRFCPDAPVPILKPNSFVSTLGMAGNVKDNLESLGVEVELISNSNKIKKTRYVDSKTNHMFIRIDEGEDDVLPIPYEALIKEIKFDYFDAVVISDYDKGFIDRATIKHISQKHPLTFLDTKKELGDWAKDITFIKINEVESQASKGFLEMADKSWSKRVISTLGSKGASYNGINYPVDEVDIKDTSGAGDTFMAGLVYAYITERNVCNAIKFANKCSTQVVQKKGTAKISILET